MSKTRFLAACLCALAAPAIARESSPSAYSGYSTADYDGYARTSQYVTVRDGTRLAVDILRPTKAGAPAQGRLPVIYIATQYRRASYKPGTREIVSFAEYEPQVLTFLRHGYTMVILDVRGTGASFGVKNGADSPANSMVMRRDLYDVADWITRQPWSDGRIGMYGVSFVASTQLATALTNAPGLKCIAPQQVPASTYRGLMNINGIQNIAFRERVDTMMQNLLVDDPAPAVDEDKDGSLLRQAIDDHRKRKPSLPTLLKLPYPDSWDADSQTAPFMLGTSAEWPLLAASGVKIYNWGGWEDVFPDASLSLQERFRASNGSRLVMGPWFHHYQSGYKDPQFDYSTELLRWYDWCVRGIDNGIDREPPILYYIEGAPEGTRWRRASQWPLPGTTNLRYYLSAGRSGSIASRNDGVLTTSAPGPAPATDSYVVDYNLTTKGLMTRYAYKSVLDHSAGTVSPDDYRALDQGAMTWTTAPLAADMQVTGAPVVRLSASADAPDADFFVYLQEVLPDGKSSPVTEGFIRASNRALGQSTMPEFGLPYHPGLSWMRQPLPADGSPVTLDFAMLPAGRVLHQGSRIRVTIFSYDKDMWDTPVRSPAPRITLHRGGANLSWVDIPTVPIEK